MEQLGSHWTNFYKILYLSIFRKTIGNLQVSSKSDKNNANFTWRPIYIFSYLANFFLEWEMFQTKIVEKIKTQNLRLITFFIFRKSYRLWDNMEEYWREGQATDDNTVHALCMLDTKDYKHALRICNSYCVSTTTVLARTRLDVT
jgi:hypothetical protein